MIEESTYSEEDLRAVVPFLPAEEPQVTLPPGGGPGRIIRVSETLLDGNEENYLRECIRTNWISSGGPFVKRLETEFAERAGCRFGVACSSGTAALHLALAVLGLGPEDEVILPAFTMIAGANCIVHAGARPVLVDSEPHTGNMDVEQLASRITPRTRAILVVHMYGHPVDMDPVLKLARQRDLVVIEDAAEAHGALYHGRPVGGIGDIGAFSFYANKIVTTGEGGMVTTNDARTAELARSLRDNAFSGGRRFVHEFCAFNYRMTNLQAAVGLAQLERLDALVEIRRRTRRFYEKHLAGIPGVRLLEELPGYRAVHWMNCILVDERHGCSRDELRRRLARNGIETRTTFVPVHLQPCYRSRFRGEAFPVSETLCRDGLLLPSGPMMNEDLVEYVAECIADVSRPAE